MLELVLGLHTHVFFGTLASGVVQEYCILRGYDSWLQISFLGTCGGWVWGLGRGGQG